jgi:hypothetical protein
MPTYNSADLNAKALWSKENGNAGIFYGTSVATSTTIATADKIRVCKVPAGMKVLKVTVINTTFGTTVPATIQFAPIDGTTAVQFGTTDAVTLQTAAANGTVFAKAPVDVAKDSFVELLVGTVSSGNGTGVATVIVEGELFGAK